MRRVHWAVGCALVLASLLALPSDVQAGDDGMFSHKDWELVCDNTRTCRAAGFQEEDDVHAVSILLTRAAGPATAVTVQLQLGDGSDEDVARVQALPDKIPLVLWLAGKPAGTVTVDKQRLVAELPTALVAALLPALGGNGRIEWKSGKATWVLSTAGATAVLLKMDETQGRLGTPGALVRRGKRDEASVLPPLPAPVVLAAAVPKTASGTVLTPAQADAMRATLRKSLGKGQDCEALTAIADKDDPDAGTLTVWPLSSTQQLVEVRCWLAPYNAGYGYWVVGGGKPPVQVTDSGSEYDGAGTITSFQKGRGIADCAWSDAWSWDGRAFVHTDSSGDGMCRMVTAGGAWSLPTLVTEVRQSAREGAGKAAKPVPARRTR